MTARLHIFLLLVFLVGCEKERDATIQLGKELVIEPGRIVVPVAESDSTVKLTLKFSINGYLNDQVYVYFFRIEDELPTTTTGLPLTSSDASGEGGGYHLSVLPGMNDDGVKFVIGFAAYDEDGKAQTDLKEFFEVPLLRDAWGQVGEIHFTANWDTL